jgi:hypothetical protein
MFEPKLIGFESNSVLNWIWFKINQIENGKLHCSIGLHSGPTRCGLASRPIPELSPIWHGPAGWQGRRAKRVRTAPTRAGRQACHGITGGRGALTRLRRAQAPPHALTGHPHDSGELVKWQGVGSGYGLTGGVGGSGIRRPPVLPVRWRNDPWGGI